MGLFTGLAIGGALAGGLFAGKKLGQRNAQAQQAQSQIPPTPGSQLTAPAPPTINPGDQMAQANRAGERQRKRAASSTLVGQAPKSDKTPASPTLRPKTLIGY
jgi:hypothetical protein